MRARVLAVLSILIAAPSLPQCNFTNVLSDPFRITMLDVVADGNDLWTATSYGISLYDRSVDPPRLAATVAVPGATRVVRIGSGLVYAGSGNTIAVVRKNGRALQLIRTVDAGAPVNDLVVTTLALYVATQNGIAQFDLVDPTNPHFAFQVSQTATTSLELDGNTLYAAEGDPTIEVFTISPIVQHTGSVTAPANVTAIHANNGKLFASSAVQTYILVNGASVGSVPFSMTSLAPIAGDAIFASGTDRTLRAIDFTTPGTPIDIFRDDLAPSGGTVNRINALTTAGGRLYAAAGDIGLVEYDASGFTSPFPMRGYPLANLSSVFSAGDTFYVGRPNGVTEFKQSTSSLTQARSWDGSRADAVQDGAAGFLLTSSGASMTMWALGTTIPGVVGTVTFRAPVVDAVLIGTAGYAVLSDRTVWSADFAQNTPSPQQFSTGSVQPVAIARSGSSIVLSDTRTDGTTTLAFYDDVKNAPHIVTVAGLALSGVTLSNTTAAVQTFSGISLIDFAAGVMTLPGSNKQIARQLVLSGSTLLELTDTTVLVWNLQTASVSAEVTLPSQAIAMHVAPQSTFADVITSSGAVVITLDRLVRMPIPIDAPNANSFYKKITASTTYLALFEPRGVDVFTNTLRYIGSIRAGGIVDVAANDNGIYALNANLTVKRYTPNGSLLLTATISEGSDAQVLSVATVGEAVWVSIVRGCTTSGCEKKTLIFDRNLNQTMSLTGAVVDVVTSGSRAYAITDLPAEIRVLNVADATHPAIIASTAATGTPVSIAYASGTLYVLGNTLASYSESSLTKIADLLPAYTSDGTVTYADQHVRIDGNCVIVTGRTFGPQFLSGSAPPAPSAARSLAAQPGVFYILTDNSLEIWSTAPLPKPPRRPPAR